MLLSLFLLICLIWKALLGCHTLDNSQTFDALIAKTPCFVFAGGFKQRAQYAALCFSSQRRHLLNHFDKTDLKIFGLWNFYFLRIMT